MQWKYVDYSQHFLQSAGIGSTVMELIGTSLLVVRHLGQDMRYKHWSFHVFGLDWYLLTCVMSVSHPSGIWLVCLGHSLVQLPKKPFTRSVQVSDSCSCGAFRTPCLHYICLKMITTPSPQYLVAIITLFSQLQQDHHARDIQSTT